MKSAYAFLVLVFTACVVQAVRQPTFSELDDSRCDEQDIGVRWNARSANDITLSFYNGCPSCRASNITYNCGEIDPDSFQGQLQGATCKVNGGAPIQYGQFEFEHLPHAPFLERLRVVSVTFDQCTFNN